MAAKERNADADGNFAFPKQEFCRLLNLTQCHVSESSPKFVVTAYNPLVRPVDRYIRIPIVTRGFDVFAPDGSKLVAQVTQESQKKWAQGCVNSSSRPGCQSRSLLTFLFDYAC